MTCTLSTTHVIVFIQEAFMRSNKKLLRIKQNPELILVNAGKRLYAPESLL